MKKQSISYRVYLTPEEKALIKRSADDCELSMSAYSRIILLGGKPSGKLDIAQCKKIEETISSLNRLGNLMKMLLTNTERLDDMGGMGEATIDGILVDIRATNAKLRELVDIVHSSHLPPGGDNDGNTESGGSGNDGTNNGSDDVKRI